MTPRVHAGDRLSDAAAHRVRTRMVFDWGKWDPQYGDRCVLAPFPLVIDAPTWRLLCTAAEDLWREALLAERAIAARPELIAQLGLGRRIGSAIGPASWSDRARFARFDFHPTPKGWMISEVNSDVPGGFIEAAGMASLMAQECPGLESPGDPGAALGEVLSSLAPPGSTVALVHATAYTDDRQVMEHLGRVIRARDLKAALCAPPHISWREGHALLDRAGGVPAPVGAIVRFFPGEWLPNLGRACHFRGFFSCATPHSNPLSSLLSQSKRFPLVWDALEHPMTTWRRFLPETLEPARVVRRWSGRRQPGWVLKPALGRVGEGIVLDGVTPERASRRLVASARLFPGAWCAQRQFDCLPIAVGNEPVYPCIGVFVVDGRAAGAYARVSASPLIDAHALDAALLIEDGVHSPIHPAHKEFAHAPAGAL